jgi:hypothetical protein
MFNVTKVELWSVPIDDTPGGLLARLEPMVKAGADLDFMLARAGGDTPGRGIVFLTPITGQRQIQAAEQVGLQRNDKLFWLRLEGPDEPGSIYRILFALKQENLNVEEASAASVMGQFVLYLAFETPTAADTAAHRLERPL